MHARFVGRLKTLSVIHKDSLAYERDNDNTMTVIDCVILCLRHHDMITNDQRSIRYNKKQLPTGVKRESTSYIPARKEPTCDAQQCVRGPSASNDERDQGDHDKRKKVDADYIQLQRLEFTAGLYFNEDWGHTSQTRTCEKW